MTSKSRVILLLVVLSIAAFLRLYHITIYPPGLYPDEAMNGNNALEALHSPSPAGGFKVFYPENNGREGLFINIQALFLKYIGRNEPWVLRLPSALFGILTVFGLYFLAKELFSARLGLLSSFLLATNFWHINFSRIGFRAITSLTYAIWGLYFLICAFKYSDPKKRSLIYAILGGIIFGLGFYSYIAYRAIPAVAIVIFAFFIIKNWRENHIKNSFLIAALFTFVSFLIFLPLGNYFLSNPGSFFGRTSQVSVFGSSMPAKDLAMNILKTAGMFIVAGDSNWRHNLSGRPELFWPVGIFLILGVLVALYYLFKNTYEKSEFSKLGILVSFAWLFVAALPVVISNEGIPHALRSVLMIPPVMMLAAIGGIWLYDYLRKHTKGATWFSVLCWVFLSLLVVEAYTTYFIRWAPSQNTADAFSSNYIQLGETLNAMSPEVPKYIIVRAGGVLEHGIPIPAQTVMFITDTYTTEGQQKKSFHYVLPEDEDEIPSGSYTAVIE